MTSTEMPTEPRRKPRRMRVAAALATTAIAAGGAGAAIHAAVTDPGSTTAAPTATVPGAIPLAATAASQLTVGQIYAAAGKSVVEIVSTVASTGPYGNSSSQQAQGTGFVYDTQGHIITNQHVIDGATAISVEFADGTKATATLVGSDASTDIAVLKVNVAASKLSPLTLTDSSKVAVGDGVVAIGDPFGLDNTVTAGIVSALDREITAPDNSAITGAIQTDAAINHGNSGGPLLDMQGKVIGITSQIESESGGNDGVGFAVPSNTIKSIATQLIATGKVEHARLGVSVQTIPADVATELSSAKGVAVGTVASGSGAAKAGLNAATGSKTVSGQSYPTGGDVITAVDGKAVATSEQLRAIIATHKPGDTVALSITRSGTSRSVTVTLGS